MMKFWSRATGRLTAAVLLLAYPLFLPELSAQVSNGILREVYAGGGSAISDLTNNPSFPEQPDG